MPEDKDIDIKGLVEKYKENYPFLYACCVFVIGVFAEQLLLWGANKFLGLLKRSYYLYIFASENRIDVEISSEVLSRLSQLFVVEFNLYVSVSVFITVFLFLFAICRYRSLIEKKRQESVMTDLNVQIKKLTNDVNTKDAEISELKPLADAQRDVLEHDKLMQALSDYAGLTQVVKCIQLYRYSEKSNDDYVDVLFEFVDGFATKDINVNALFRMNYHFDVNTYDTLRRLIVDINYYYRSVKSSSNKMTERDFHTRIKTLFAEIADRLNVLHDISEITDIHYAYYRILEILTTMVVGSHTLIECKKLLNYSSEIEAQLRTGQRTGMLGTFFLNETYYFGNDNSYVKRDRGYFASPIRFKESDMIMLVVVSRNNLKVGTNENEVDACRRIFEEIKVHLTESFREGRNVA